MQRPKIAIVHQSKLVCGGGAEACALWAAEVLKKDYRVSLIAMGQVDIEKLNNCYGTEIKNGEINIISIPVLRLFKNRFDALRPYRLVRFCKKIAPDFDIMISTFNQMDFGKRGIQFIADLSFGDELRRAYDPQKNKPQKWLYQNSLLRKCYLKFSAILSGFSKDSWKKNLTIANSVWENGILKKTYKINSLVVYPPVIGKFENIEWDKKENGFILLGRISPEKEIEKVIRILKIVQKNNPDIHLHIIGRIDNVDYAEFIKKLCDQNKSWCFLGESMYGQEKSDFIAKHKFGISGRTNEPFGISVAEMAKAGCIVFVPNGGGQTEIVNATQLIYENEHDAVEKINKVLNDRNMQIKLQKNLLKISQKFSTESFGKSMKDVVSKFFESV